MSYLGRSAKLSLKAQEKVSFLATAGQTSKTGLSYTPSFIEVYVNGVLLTDTTDFTATNGNSVTFTVALLLNDEVTVISLKTFTVADHYNKTEADTLLAAKATNTALATTNTAVALKAPIASPAFTGNVGVSSSSYPILQATATTTNNASLRLRGSLSSAHYWDIQHVHGDNDLTFGWSGDERMRIDADGNVGINTASPTAMLHIVGANAAAAAKIIGGATNGYYNLEIQNNASNGYGVGFKDGGSIVGSIQTTGSATSYNTSSDYRLKENVTPMSGATAQTKLLKPCNFDWIVGGNVNGFIAHELAEVVPEAVTGTKDAMRDEEYEVTPAVLDDEGNETTAAVMGTRSVPDMQGIDQAKLVPLLTATIQELIARIEALEGE